MQIFLPYKSPLETAKCLDKRRLHKQILECQQVIDILEGRRITWRNHPICKMYFGHIDFLKNYLKVLKTYRQNPENTSELIVLDIKASLTLPFFINDEYCNNVKKRLYTKDPAHYEFFSIFGQSEINYYYVNGAWFKYKNGKQI